MALSKPPVNIEKLQKRPLKFCIIILNYQHCSIIITSKYIFIQSNHVPYVGAAKEHIKVWFFVKMMKIVVHRPFTHYNCSI